MAITGERVGRGRDGTEAGRISISSGTRGACLPVQRSRAAVRLLVVHRPRLSTRTKVFARRETAKSAPHVRAGAKWSERRSMMNFGIRTRQYRDSFARAIRNENGIRITVISLARLRGVISRLINHRRDFNFPLLHEAPPATIFVRSPLGRVSGVVPAGWQSFRRITDFSDERYSGALVLALLLN